jgi:hypothetical protein
MSKTRVCLFCCCVLALAAFAQAQSGRKPGLYEITSQMSMGGAGAPQMPQLPPGVKLPPGVQMPQGMGGPIVTRTCVTQAMIDKYGGPSPAPQQGQCRVTDVTMKSNGMTAKIICTGQMNATGTVETTWIDANSSHTKMHMTGTMQVGQGSRPIDMTSESTSVYKGPDCGSVKPPPIPASN